MEKKMVKKSKQRRWNDEGKIAVRMSEKVIRIYTNLFT